MILKMGRGVSVFVLFCVLQWTRAQFGSEYEYNL